MQDKAGPTSGSASLGFQVCRSRDTERARAKDGAMYVVAVVEGARRKKKRRVGPRELVLMVVECFG